MDKNSKAFLIGVSIGDGYLGGYANSKSVCLKLVHSIKQEEYMLWKISRIRSIVGGSEGKITYFDNSGYPGIRWQKSHRYFRVIRKWLYNNNKKEISKNVLEKLTHEAIAVWWMDDGSMYKKLNPKTRKIKAVEGILSTYCSLEENEIIVNYFKLKYDIEFKVVRSKNSFRLRLNTSECRKFASLVRPYMHKSLLYKIDIVTDNSLEHEHRTAYL